VNTVGLIRKLALATLSVLVAAGLGAPGALAEREVATEASGVHCGATVTESTAPATPEVSGGCPFELIGDDVEIGGPMGVMTECDIVLEGRISESADAIASTYSVSSCTPTPNTATVCTADGERHPAFRITGDATAGVWPTEVEICFNAWGATIHCHVSAGMLDAGSHDYRIDLSHGETCDGNASYSLEGQLAQNVDDDHPALEIRDVAPVEVANEESGEHCDTTVTEGGAEGCPVQFETNGLELSAVSAMNMSLCDVYIEGRMSEEGVFVADVFDVAPVSMGPCDLGSFSECAALGQQHPTITVTGGTSPTWTTEVEICLTIPFLGSWDCHLGAEIVETGSHLYALRFAHADACDNTPFRLSIQGDIPQVIDEEHPEIEIVD